MIYKITKFKLQYIVYKAKNIGKPPKGLKINVPKKYTLQNTRFNQMHFITTKNRQSFMNLHM